MVVTVMRSTGTSWRVYRDGTRRRGVRKGNRRNVVVVTLSEKLHSVQYFRVCFVSLQRPRCRVDSLSRNRQRGESEEEVVEDLARDGVLYDDEASSQC